MLLFLAVAGPARATADYNATKQIWKLKYGVTDAQIADSSWLSADSDGDGVKNDDEIAAGTNPFVAGSVLKITTITTTSTDVSVTFPTSSGKQYVLQGSPTLGGFSSTGLTVTGDGTAKTLTGPKDSNKFFRVLVQDIDTDNDGVGDWAEIAVGLDPNVSETISGQTTLAYVNQQIALPNVVTIKATNSFASEDGPTAGTLTVTRTQDLFPITVTYGVSGTAVPSTDYTPLAGSVAFVARGVISQDISVTPIVQAALKGGRSVTATLNAAGAVDFPFTLGSPNTATVIINESVAPTGTGLLGKYYDTSSTTYGNSANFNAAQLKVTRVDPTVNFDWEYGTPNGNTALTSPDNYSVSWEGYLAPSSNNTYTFQLDANDKARVFLDTGSGLVQILENGWDTAATGGFKQSATFSLSVPATPANRYHIKVEFIELTGDATCRFQWKVGSASYANIPSTNVFTDNVGTTAGYVGKYYDGTNTDFSMNTLKVTQTDTAVTNGNNGIWGSGTPDVTSIDRNTFSVRWTGQVQPQFTEEYTFVVQADDGVLLKLNGQTQVLSMVPSANTSGSTYSYNATTGDLSVNYSGLIVNPSSFVAGETVRLDCTSGNLNHTPATPATYDYDPVSGNMVVDYTNLVPPAIGGTRTAGSYLVGEKVELDPTSGGVSSLATAPYVITAADTVNNKFTVNVGSIAPAVTVSSIATGNPCEVTTAQDHGLSTGAKVTIASVSGGTFSPAINGLYTVTVVNSKKFTVASDCTLSPTVSTGTVSPSGNVTMADTRNAVVLASPAPTASTFTVNIGPGKYADASTGNVSIDIANKGLKDWSSNTNERYVRIPMVGGTRYDIQLDYYENTGAAKCLLSWYSPSQPKQIIPAERLYPSSVAQAPPAYIASTDATWLTGGAFSYPIAGSNGSSVSISGNPGWLTYSGGSLTGTPPSNAAGDYQIIITLTNSNGTSTSLLNLHVDSNPGNVVREYWNGVSGTAIADIPTATNPTGSGNLPTLEAPTDFGDNYGQRIRGYITAPVTGNYYFWLAANNTAELWISNDSEPINAFRRAYLTAGSTTPQDWNVAGQTHQKSPWLALEQGKKYYVEILHNGASGSGDNLAIGWSKPGESTATPSQVVPSHVLLPYTAPAPGSSPGTLYLATMLSQAGAVTNGVGSSTLRVTEDGGTAYMKFSYSGLTGPLTAKHIHSDPYLTHPSAIIFDIDTPANPGDGLITNPADPNFGAYKWTITPIAGLSSAEIVELIREGKAYINLHTAAYPNGEIRGNYTLANGTRTFTPPPAPPTWADDSNTDAGAVRFLTQATFGANTADIAALKALSPTGGGTYYPASRYETWLNNQFALGATHHLDEVLAREIADAFGAFDVKLSINTWWKTSISAADQLRQKVAQSLSEIHVVSTAGPLLDNSRAISDFYDTLLDNAFGNFKDVLVGTTLTSGMGRYLDMLRNDKQDLTIGKIPNENYAREIMQLFSIGLFREWPDGTLMLTSTDSPIDTYSQREIVGVAHVFTGWDYGYDGPYHTSFNAVADWTRPMREVPARHDTGPKRILNNEVLPGLATLGNQPLDQDSTHISTSYNDPLYAALAAQELDAVHTQLFNHPNVGPFVCRQLIQRLVTSSPSRDYIYRVVQKFNDDGTGVRGNMQAVIKAILLDYEARHNDLLSSPAYGKQREPMMRVANAARAFRPTQVTGTYSQTGALSTSNKPVITITTSTSHFLEAGDSVFLEFTDTTGDPAKPAPTTGIYAVKSVGSSTQYTVEATGWIAGSYNQPANSSTMTITLSGHWLPAGGQAYFDFTSGAADGLAGFDQTTHTAATSTSVDFPGGSGNNSGTTFTIAGISPTTGSARSGNVMICRFVGSYSASATGAVANQFRYTIDTTSGGAGSYGAQSNHHLVPGDNAFLNFYTTRDTTSGSPTTTANDLAYLVDAVPDLNSFQVISQVAANAAIGNDNGVYIFPLKAQPLVRSGTVNTRLGTFSMDNTDNDLGQTPLSSPTVFNYFLPDYRFPGTIASQGITTPEFQGTSETTVVRHNNFVYDGVFNPSGDTNGISSFKAGGNSLVIDFSPWFGNATNTVLGNGPQTSQKWVSNANLPTFVDRMNTLLLAGQLPAGTKTSIVNFLYRTITGISAAPSNPTVITSPAHGLLSGDTITIYGVSGGTYSSGINGVAFLVTKIDNDTFSIPTNHSSGTSTFGSAHFSTIQYDNAAPTTTQVRDRIRAVIHFILTSPDYTIQR